MNIIKIDNTRGALVFDLFNQYRIFYKQPSDIQLAKDFIQARLDRRDSVIFVALSDDGSDPVGFTQLYPQYSSVRAARYWILNDLYVDGSCRRQGVGGKLIRAALDFAKDDKAAFVELSTAIDNHIAQSLYEHTGFRQYADTGFYTYRISLG